MGQVLHGSATTTEAIRRAIQHSQESLRALAKRYGINQKTVVKWKNRDSVADLPTGPKEPTSTVLSIEEEAIIVAFRRHTLLPLDDCLYSLQATVPRLTRSSLHRCLQRHGISRLPKVEGDKPAITKFKSHPIGFFHIDIAEAQTAEGKLYLFVAVDRTSKFAYVELHRQPSGKPPATSCAISSKPWPEAACLGSQLRIRLRPTRHRASADQAQASLDQRTGRANEPRDQASRRPTLSLRRPQPARSPSRRLR